jgi:hypothetical protein
MSMSKSRRRWPVLAALSLTVFSSRPLLDNPLSGLSRLVAARDPEFAMPDSVRAMLTRVTAMVSDTDSSLYLADPSLGAVLNLTPDGGFRKVIGRRGAGPGEFNTVLLVGLHQDSLWALDPAMVRLTLVPLRGSGALTVPLGISAPTLARRGRPQTRRGFPIAILADGNFLIDESVRDEGDGGQWDHRLLLRASRNLEVLDTIARQSLGHSTMVFSYRDGESHFPQPFSDDPLYAASPDGRLLVTIEREVPGKGTDGILRITGYQDAHTQIFRREIEYAGQPLSGSAVDSAVQFYVNPKAQTGPATPITADSIRRHLFRPRIYPPVEAARVARDGSIWLKVHFADSPRGVGDWLVLSRKGLEMYRVSLPESFQLFEANHRTVWGLEGDVLDVPLVVRYTIPGRPA